MSRFDKSLPIKLDADGNLDTDFLAKELKSALDYDVHYKQVDNMKKKAIRNSGTYDDFKAKVACSHLKTLTSKEVESLSAKKTGWQREFRPGNETDAHILAHEAKKLDLEIAKNISREKKLDLAGGSTESIPLPKNLVVLESFLCRTLRDNDARMQYLMAVGLKRLKLLFKGDKDCTPELLQVLLETVIHAAKLQTESKTESSKVACTQTAVTNAAEFQSNEASASILLVENNAEKQQSGEDIEKRMDIFKWLKNITALPRFSITIMFVPKPLIDAVVTYLSQYVDENAAIEALRAEVLAKYVTK